MSEHPHYSQYPRQGAPGPAGWRPGYPGPPPPGYAGPVPPSPGGGRTKKTRWVVVAVVAAVVVAAGAGGAWVWLRDGGSGGGIAAEAGTQLTLTLEDRYPKDWQPDGDEIEYSVGSFVEGRWWTEGHLVREMPNEIVAYDLAGGSAAWRLPVPGNGACLSSREMSAEGYVAVLRGDGLGSEAEKGCHQLTLVDVTAGKEVWTVELDQVAGKFPSASSFPVIAGGLVHVASENGAQSRAIADGAPSEQKAQPQGCIAKDYLGVDGVLVAWLRCKAGDEILWILAGYDENVKALWGWIHPERTPQKPSLRSVLSVDPLLVVVAPERPRQEIWRVEPGFGSRDDPGTHSVVTTSSEKVMRPCGDVGSGLSVCADVVVGDGSVYLRSLLDANGRQKGVIAVDLDTGEERWHARADGELSISPLRIDEEGRLIAYQAQSELGAEQETPGVVVALDPGNGSLTALAALPMIEGGAPWEFVVENSDLGSDTLEWRDGQLAFVSPVVVVTKEGGGGGAGSMATLIFS